MESFISSALNKSVSQQPVGTQARIERAGDINWESKVSEEFKIDMHRAKIMVMGCGGGGNNTVTRLKEMGISGAEIVAVNTDAKHLSITKSDKKLLIGKETTRGLGAGGYPEVGRKSAEEQKNEIKQLLDGVDLLFVTAGMGGGTGTGTAPVVAEIAKSMGAIVVGAVTMPFKMEGTRMQKAEDGISKLRQVTDTVVVIENQKLLEYAGQLPISQAFALADELISTMIKGITETITVPSLVNLDFADVKTIMRCGGLSAICVGKSDSQNKIKDAVTKALNHPLLEVDFAGAMGALIHVICGNDCTLSEINEAGEMISKRLNPEAQVIWGARVMPEFTGKVEIITIITGVKSPYLLGPVTREEAVKTAESELGIPVIR